MGLSDGGVVCCTDRWVSSQGSHAKNPLDPEAAGAGAGPVPNDTLDVSPPPLTWPPGLPPLASDLMASFSHSLAGIL